MGFIRTRRHPRAELACPPLRWRAVGRRVLRASAVAAVTGAAGALVLVRWDPASQRWALVGCVVLFAACGAALLRLTHLVNAARTPVTFSIANGELVVTRPFLFARRRKRMRTSDVRAVTVSAASPARGAPQPTARLSIARRHRLPVRIPGRRPLGEVDRVAGELRAVLGV